MTDLVPLIRERVAKVEAEMAATTAKAGRPVDSTRLLVVAKKHSVQTIQAAVEAGLTSFGENYPEEAATKLAHFQGQPNLHWEMIGHIQSRKADLVAQGFDLIHSIDSLKLATKLNRLRETARLPQDILLEVNIAGESNKDGYCLDTESSKTFFYADLEAIARLENLKVIGLMCMPPLQEKPEQNRVYFAALRELRELINERFGWKMSELSMGTSTDFQVAIEEGATVIRIGEAILGKRA